MKRSVERIIHFYANYAFGSAGICLAAGFCIGIIITWQGAVQLAPFGALDFLSGQAFRGIVAEIAPLFTGILIAGRVGTGITAEIGVMQLSEQLTALKMLGISPNYFLCFPRVIALMFSLPTLTLLTDYGAIIGIYFSGTFLVGLSPAIITDSLTGAFLPDEWLTGLLITLLFGTWVGINAYRHGYYLRVEGDSSELGKATVRSFVFSVVGILIFDALLKLIP
jgi:phospholipid/cholesterol/gamma-HCH transport system permease protein